MKKLLLVVGAFDPYRNANTNCVSRVVAALQARGYDVSVLTAAYEKTLPDIEQRCGCTVYRVKIAEIDTMDRLLYRNPRLSRGPLRIVRGVLHKLAELQIDFLLRRRTAAVMKKTDGPFPYMLSVINPARAHAVASRFVRGGTKWIMYNLDPYVFNPAVNGSTRLREIRERRWCRRAAGVINVNGMDAENARNGYVPYAGCPRTELPLPNFTLCRETFLEKKTASDEPVILRYTGMFYGNIRRPDELIRFLHTLDPAKYRAEFYGDCCEYLRSHFEDLPACVHLMGSVSVEKCRALTASADILLNVGNLSRHQIPSKLFEYIATGKPILNFYSLEEEPGMQYMRRYPCALNVRSADDVTAADLDALCVQSKAVTFEMLQDLYADVLSESVTGRLIDFIESV